MEHCRCTVEMGRSVSVRRALMVRELDSDVYVSTSATQFETADLNIDCAACGTPITIAERCGAKAVAELIEECHLACE